MDGIIAIRHGNTHQRTAKKYGNLQSPQGRNRAKQKEQQEHILEIMIQPEIQVGVSFRSLQRILDVVHSYSMEKSSSAEIGGTTIHSSSGATTTSCSVASTSVAATSSETGHVGGGECVGECASAREVSEVGDEVRWGEGR